MAHKFGSLGDMNIEAKGTNSKSDRLVAPRLFDYSNNHIQKSPENSPLTPTRFGGNLFFLVLFSPSLAAFMRSNDF